MSSVLTAEGMNQAFHPEVTEEHRLNAVYKFGEFVRGVLLDLLNGRDPKDFGFKTEQDLYRTVALPIAEDIARGHGGVIELPDRLKQALSESAIHPAEEVRIAG